MAVDRIAEEMGKRGVADVFKWWLFMATDVIGELSFGESFRMLEAGEVSRTSEAKAFWMIANEGTPQRKPNIAWTSNKSPVSSQSELPSPSLSN